jgi:chromosome segregation ATPase
VLLSSDEGNYLSRLRVEFRIDISMNWTRPLLRLSSVLLFVVVPICIAGVLFTRSCAFPRSVSDERSEALRVARLLETLKPESERLSSEERSCANQLKVLLDEFKSNDIARFQPKIDDALAKLTSINAGRAKLRATLSVLRLTTPLPRAVEEDVSYMFQESRIQVESWIQLLQNLRQREESEAEQIFPEVSRLTRLVDLFLGISEEEPVKRSIGRLKIEYGFSDGEIGP